ncbi:hypothetical protein ABPG74_006173 [Tetrahymena malaccensis]
MQQEYPEIQKIFQQDFNNSNIFFQKSTCYSLYYLTFRNQSSCSKSFQTQLLLQENQENSHNIQQKSFFFYFLTCQKFFLLKFNIILLQRERMMQQKNNKQIKTVIIT